MMKCKQRVKDNHPRTPQKLLDPEMGIFRGKYCGIRAKDSDAEWIPPWIYFYDL